MFTGVVSRIKKSGDNYRFINSILIKCDIAIHCNTDTKNDTYLCSNSKRCLNLLTREKSKLLHSIGISPFSLKNLNFASLKCACNIHAHTEWKDMHQGIYLLWLFLSRRGYKCLF